MAKMSSGNARLIGRNDPLLYGGFAPKHRSHGWLTMSSLTIAGFLFGLVSLFFLPVVFAPLGMGLGVVTLLKGRAENGLAVIVIAAVCGYFGFASTLPLDNPWNTESVRTVESWFNNSPPVAVLPANDVWQVVSLESHVSQDGDDDPVCSWRLVVKNNSQQPTTFHGTIDLQDSQGVSVVQDPIQGYSVAPGALGIFTGSTPIRSKTRIARAVPQIPSGG